MGAFDNITIRVKEQINCANLHQDDIIITNKAAISSIIKTLHKPSLQEMYVSKLCDDHNIDLYHLEFNFF